MGQVKAPNHLSVEAKRWWRELQKEFDISDAAGMLLLQTACEAHDRMKLAMVEIERDGQTLMDRFSQPKPHPMLTVERDARAAMLAALKQLNLDLLPLRDGPGRPGGQ